MTPDCPVCLIEHDAAVHQATLRVRRWFGERVALSLKPLKEVKLAKRSPLEPPPNKKTDITPGRVAEQRMLGLSNKQIAAKLGVSQKTVADRLHEWAGSVDRKRGGRFNPYPGVDA